MSGADYTDGSGGPIDAVPEPALGRTPLGRIGRVEDLVGAIVYLSSPAAGLVTGQTLAVDGGWTAM